MKANIKETSSPAWVNQKTLASILGVSVPTIIAWRAAGLPAYTVGARRCGHGVKYLFDPQEVRQWMDGNRRAVRIAGLDGTAAANCLDNAAEA